MHSPVWLHLLPQHRQVIVAQHRSIQGIDPLPGVGWGMRRLTMILYSDAEKHKTITLLSLLSLLVRPLQERWVAACVLFCKKTKNIVYFFLSFTWKIQARRNMEYLLSVYDNIIEFSFLSFSFYTMDYTGALTKMYYLVVDFFKAGILFRICLWCICECICSSLAFYILYCSSFGLNYLCCTVYVIAVLKGISPL